jgi:hypothetical protein
MESDPVAAVRAALADMDTAHDTAVAAINAAPDRVASSAAVRELVTHTKALSESDDDLQKQLAGRIWDAEKLSLAGLADRVGMSKRRAEQQAEGIEQGEDPPA